MSKTYKNIRYNQLCKAGYNRGIVRAWVNQIKENWTDDLEQPAIVSFRDGKYWIIDHQHQTQAKYELNGCDPNMLVYCDVRSGMTYEQEAALYYRLNTSSKILKFPDRLKGLIEAKDATALQFRDVVESCGYTVDGHSSNLLRALSKAWSIYNKVDGDKRLAEILKLTHDCWPNNTMSACSVIIDGVDLFLKNHGGEYDRKRFIKALSPVEPREIVSKSRAYYKQMDSKTFTQPYCTYTMLANSYNVGLKYRLVIAQPF